MTFCTWTAMAAWCPSVLVVMACWLLAATAAAARFIRMSLHSSAVSWIGPSGDINAVAPPVPPVVVSMVFVFESMIPFARAELDWFIISCFLTPGWPAVTVAVVPLVVIMRWAVPCCSADGSLTTIIRRTEPLLVACVIVPLASFCTIMLAPSGNCKYGIVASLTV